MPGPSALRLAERLAALNENRLAGRFASNSARQAIGAALFFATTMLLSSSLGTSGYTAFFRNWNAANLLASVSEFGLFSDIMRRFVLRQSAGEVARVALRLFAAQWVVIGAVALVAGVWTDYDPWFMLLAAGSVAISNVLSASALGRDMFRTFMVGELTQNSALFLLVVATTPTQPRFIGFLLLASVAIKACAYVLLRGEAPRAAASLAGARPPLTTMQPGYAGRAYVHSLALMSTYRGFFVIVSSILGPLQLDRIALPWSLCDRALVLVQGVSLVLQPRLIAGMVSRRARNGIYVATMAMFVVVALAMTGLAQLWLARGGVVHDGLLVTSALLCSAFVPHVLRTLRLQEYAALGRFSPVFYSHLAAVVAFAGISVLGWLLPMDGAAFAALLVGVVSVVGLCAFGEWKSGDSLSDPLEAS